MPFYEYRCDDCGDQITVQHGMNDSPDYKCESCGHSMSKIFSKVHHFARGNSRWEDIKKDPSFRRDKHLYELENSDPYAHMRTKDDKEATKSRLQKIGKPNYDKDGNYTGSKFFVKDRKSSKTKKSDSK